MPKTASLIVIIVVGLMILVGLGRQINDAIRAGDRLDMAVEEVNNLQTENRELKNKLSQVNTAQFTEEIARNQLNMAKEGETIVVIPDELIEKVLGADIKPIEIKMPNWQGWLKLFIH